MRDSQLFTVVEGQFLERIFVAIREGVQGSRLLCGWHKTRAYITVLLQCPHCLFLAGAEIYTTSQINGVTREDFYAVQILLADMLGVEIGPNQGV